MAKPDWITLDKSSGVGDETVSVTCAQNTSFMSRTGTVTGENADGVTDSVTITQSGTPVELIAGGSSGYLGRVTFPDNMNLSTKTGTSQWTDFTYNPQMGKYIVASKEYLALSEDGSSWEEPLSTDGGYRSFPVDKLRTYNGVGPIYWSVKGCFGYYVKAGTNEGEWARYDSRWYPAIRYGDRVYWVGSSTVKASPAAALPVDNQVSDIFDLTTIGVNSIANIYDGAVFKDKLYLSTVQGDIVSCGEDGLEFSYVIDIGERGQFISSEDVLVYVWNDGAKWTSDGSTWNDCEGYDGCFGTPADFYVTVDYYNGIYMAFVASKTLDYIKKLLLSSDGKTWSSSSLSASPDIKGMCLFRE